MNTRILGFAALFIVLAGALAFIVQQVNVSETERQNGGVVHETPTQPSIPNAPFTFKSADAVTSVSFPLESVQSGFVQFDNPTMMYGTTTAFEQTFAWKVIDANGVVIAEHSAMTHGPDAGIPAPFEVTMFYDKAPTTARGTLTVYEASAKDGSPIHEVKIPVIFAKTVSSGCDKNISIAFVESGGAHLDCSATKTVARTVCADAGTVSDVALYELLKGPTAAEQARGVTTSLPPSVTYPRRGVTVPTTHESITYDFNSDLEAGVAGSCRVGSIRAQITNTVRANTLQTGGDGIVIGINGRTADILQP